MKTKKCTKCNKIKLASDFYAYNLCNMCRRKYEKEYRTKNIIRCRARGVRCYYKYHQKNKQKALQYYYKHKKQINHLANERNKKRRKHDINFKIKTQLRTRIYLALKNNQKSGNTLKLLGCSVEFLKKHLKSKFQEGMSWDNYCSFWEIDHIKLCASFDLSKPEAQRKCFHYTNLQPLTLKENRSKNRT